MELIDYFKLVRKYFSAVIVTIVITVGITAIATTVVPKTYTATVIMQSNQNFNIPTYASTSTSRLNASLNNIVGLTNQPQFKQEVVGFFKKQKEKTLLAVTSFTISAQLINESNLIELKVEAKNNPKLARKVAMAASSILIDRSSMATLDKTTHLVRTMKKKIRSVDSDLVTIRKKIEATKDKKELDKTKLKIKLGSLSDKLTEVLDTRKTYVDLVNRLAINNTLTNARLQLIYPAAVPTVHSSPKMANNLIISLTVGLMLGVALVSTLGRKETNELHAEKDKG
ncbi:hypothetical protein LCGC14_2053690 [marine sediment metagenome]|uniref:Polysaccharide chain length determinant N-terminal domain-containing protein n=1 Tax=marine sediment metagenome TaxID=412755 RepID=A0A0F9EN81_9ZZZZ